MMPHQSRFIENDFDNPSVSVSPLVWEDGGIPAGYQFEQMPMPPVSQPTRSPLPAMFVPSPQPPFGRQSFDDRPSFDDRQLLDYRQQGPGFVPQPMESEVTATPTVSWLPAQPSRSSTASDQTQPTALKKSFTDILPESNLAYAPELDEFEDEDEGRHHLFHRHHHNHNHDDNQQHQGHESGIGGKQRFKKIMHRGIKKMDEWMQQASTEAVKQRRFRSNAMRDKYENA